MNRTNARNTGKEFEKQILDVLVQYQSSGVMRLKKVDPPVRVVGSGAFRRILFLSNPWLDWVGCWTQRGGRAVLIEAKSTADPKLPFLTSGGLTQTQFDTLRNWHNCGAATGILWQFDGQVKFIPGAGVITLIENWKWGMSYKYVPWGADVTGPVLKKTGKFVHFDFAERMGKIWPA